MRIMELRTPAAVVWPDDYGQVQAAVVCATKSGVKPIPRSGGFSFENLSTADGALVIDLTNMHSVKVNVQSMTATVQSGARMGNVYADIFEAGRAGGAGRNLTCLGGTSPMIGFGGLMAAGGYGAFTRMHGLLSDSVIRAKVVDAKGRLLEASQDTNPDLLFAVSGGGGGTYGIVVEATVKLFEIPVVTLARIKYEGVDRAVEVWDRFQRWGPEAPPELSVKFNLKPGKTDINIQYIGRKRDLDKLIYDVSGLALPGATYEAAECDVQGSRAWTPETSVIQAGSSGGGSGGGWKTLSHWLVAPYCSADPGSTRVPQRAAPGGPVAFTREAAQYRSAYFSSPIPRPGLERLREVFTAGAVTKNWRQILCRVHGPGIRKLPDGGGSAFGNRGQRMICEYGVSFAMRKEGRSLPEEVAGPAWEWFRGAREAVGTLASGAEYNGWINRFDGPGGSKYFGANYGRLRVVKKKHDPGNVFSNPLSVPPAA